MMMLMSLDLGRSAVKVAVSSADGKVVTMLWPPLVARLDTPPSPRVVNEIEDRQDGAVVQVDSRWWAVGDAARLGGHAAIWRRDERKADSPHVIRAVVAAACPGVEGDLPVAVALPAGLWRAQGEYLARILADPVQVRLFGEARKRWISPRTYVLAEPVAAWCSLVLSHGGTPTADVGGTWVVADSGHRTLDVAVLVGARPTDLRSTPLGGLLAWEAWLHEAVEPLYGLLRDDEAAGIIAAVASGSVPVVRGRQLTGEVIGEIDRYRRQWAAMLVEALRSLLASVAYDRLVFAGGGAEWARDELLQAYPHAAFAPSPRWAVADGALRYLRYLQRRKEA